jgi:uncharacterized protein YpmS
MRFKLVLLALFTLLVASVASSREHVRIDASSDEAANASFLKMMHESSREKQKELQIALVQLNFAGVHSAYEVVNDPNKQVADAAHVKAKIVGMDADEIIAFAARNRKPGDPTVEVK